MSPAFVDKTRRGAAVENVAETIRQRIRAGQYEPGQRLVEADLTSDLGVSRGPVREAFRRLAAEGLVELQPNRGATVHRLSRAEVVELLEVLQALGELAVANVARRAGSRETSKLLREEIAKSRAFRRRAGSGLGVVDYIEENARFHSALTEMSGNRLLARLLGQLQLHFFRLASHGLLTHASHGEWTADHEMILRAIRTGDPRKAERAIRAYGKRIRVLILSLSYPALE